MPSHPNTMSEEKRKKREEAGYGADWEWTWDKMRKSFVYGSDTAENKLGNPHFIKLLAKDKKLTKLRTSALAISFIDHMVIERMGVDPIWVAAFCEEQRSRPARVHHPLTDLLLGLLHIRFPEHSDAKRGFLSTLLCDHYPSVAVVESKTSSKMTAESLRCELPASGRVKANAAAPASPKNKWQFEEKEILIVDHVISVWKEMLPPMENHEIGEYLFATKQKGSFGPCWKTSLARDVLVTVIGVRTKRLWFPLGEDKKERRQFSLEKGYILDCVKRHCSGWSPGSRLAVVASPSADGYNDNSLRLFNEATHRDRLLTAFLKLPGVDPATDMNTMIQMIMSEDTAEERKIPWDLLCELYSPVYTSSTRIQFVIGVRAWASDSDRDHTRSKWTADPEMFACKLHIELSYRQANSVAIERSRAIADILTAHGFFVSKGGVSARLFRKRAIDGVANGLQQLQLLCPRWWSAMDLPLDVFEVLRTHFAREVDGHASPTTSSHIESTPTTEMWQQMDAGDSALPNRSLDTYDDFTTYAAQVPTQRADNMNTQNYEDRCRTHRAIVKATIWKLVDREFAGSM